MDSEKTAPSHRVIRYLLDRRRPGSQKSRIGNEILKKLTSGSVPGASRDPPDASRSYLELRGVSGADLGPKNPFPIQRSRKNPNPIQRSGQDRSCSPGYRAKKSKPHTEIPKKTGSAHRVIAHTRSAAVSGSQLQVTGSVSAGVDPTPVSRA
jgi:hypothetical protein